MTKNFTLAFLLSIQFIGAFAQANLPKSLTMPFFSREVPVETMPAVDVPTLMAEDDINNALKIGPYRFGENIAVNINASTHGLWEEMKGGARIWRMGFRSVGAYSVNFIFDDLHLPLGSTFHLYDADGENIYGPFTNADNRADGGFATFPIPGELVFIEYYEPGNMRGEGRISLQTVTHAYRDIFHLDGQRGGGSGSCNNNVNCPEGDPWQDQKRSVAIMISDGSGFCTGAMVNNTAQDGTPYFLSANHCMGGGTDNWVFKFNYERPDCANTGGPNLTGGQFTQGAVIRAQNEGSDFALLELDAAPDPAHEVFYSGWDRSGNIPSNQVAIHHPSGDYKKISFDNDPAAPEADWGGAACWHIADWEDGTTEPGSSGSPLFDQNQRVIGQLYGGTANCDNNIDDYYGRFDVSWDGPSANSRLRDWLDPSNTGVTTLDGFDPNAPTVALDAAAQSIGGVASGSTLCDNQVTPTLSLRNRGTDELTSAIITWTVDGVDQAPLNWTGSLDFNETQILTFSLLTFGPGEHTIEFSVSSPNGSSDENVNNNIVSVTFTTVDGDEINVNIQTDQYSEETSWEIRNESNAVVASGSGYDSNALVTIPTCLADGCYTFTIFDEYGDGICCQFGQGYYEVNDPFGNILGEGAQFGDDESVEFCLPLIVPEPEANFSVANSTLCTSDAVTFVNTSTPNSGVSYSWVFEGGTPGTSSAASPSVTYNSSGTFDVSLTVTNSAGSDVQTSSNYITVNVSPSATTTSTGENLWAGGANGTATVEVSGGTPPYDISWSSGGSSEPTITGLEAGNYTVTVTDDNGCEVTSTVTVGSNVGINDLSLAEAIRTYPNPSPGLINIEIPAEYDVNHISISDMTGRTVRQIAIQHVQRTTIDISALAEGVYHINFFTANSRATKKLVHLRP